MASGTGHGAGASVARRLPQIPFHYAAILPALALSAVIILVPLLYALGLSLFRYRLTDLANTRFIGLENYLTVLDQPAFLSSVRVTIIYTAAALVVELVLGMGIALLVHYGVAETSILRPLIVAAVMIPLFITPVVAADIWRALLHPDLGVINYYLSQLGIIGKSVAWLGDKDWALPAVILVDVWRTTPFLFLCILAGLQAMPLELYDAASVDGASSVQSFFYVTLPLLRPLLLVVLIIRGMDALVTFDTIYVLTSGGPGSVTQLITMSAFQLAFRSYDIGLGAAIAFVIFAVVLVLCIFFVRELQKARVE